MSLHLPVLFVGDRPNPRKNLDINTPFVGTPSYKTLLDWIYRMDIDLNCVLMSNAFTAEGKENPVLTLDVYNDNVQKIVALGEAARSTLSEMDCVFFTLPHPSGLNRALNDKKKLAEQLALCRAFIYKR